jgi:uncharacterized protein YdhG (YjbR/CyaY superfamily)
MRAKPEDINAYIDGFPEDVQVKLEQIRATVKKAAPGVEETISYGIPCFTLNGRYLVYMAGFKNHLSVYPAPRNSEVFRKELSTYKGGKGTIQFPLDKPLPLGLISRIVKFKVKESREMVSKKKPVKRKVKRNE